LLEFYCPDDLEVLTSIGSTNLIKDHKVDRAYSDHLPLAIRLTVERKV
jgi:hypothetical protein